MPPIKSSPSFGPTFPLSNPLSLFDGDDEGSEIRSSTGIGIDWLTPVGPLNFTLSTTLNKADKDKTETFRFN